MAKPKPFKRNDRHVEDFKGVEAYIPEHLKEPEPESLNLSMCSDPSTGQPF
jgi:hypothetical protein